MVGGIDLTEFIPFATWHWTTILHYLLLLVAIVVLGLSSGTSDVPSALLLVLAVLALVVGMSLYVNFFPFLLRNRFWIFLIRTGMLALPVFVAGLAPNEQGRGLGILLAVLGFPLFAMTLANPLLPGFLADPRVPW